MELCQPRVGHYNADFYEEDLRLQGFCYGVDRAKQIHVNMAGGEMVK
jgi:hypothetical protein